MILKVFLKEWPRLSFTARIERTPIFYLFAFCAREGLDWPLPCSFIPSCLYFIFRDGGLVDPSLRASNEHILIVRDPQEHAEDVPGKPSSEGRLRPRVATSTGDHLVCPLLPLLLLDDDLNAAVLGTPCIRVVAGNRVTVPVACGR